MKKFTMIHSLQYVSLLSLYSLYSLYSLSLPLSHTLSLSLSNQLQGLVMAQKRSLPVLILPAHAHTRLLA